MEYKVLRYQNNRRGSKAMQKDLDALAPQGWRLVSSVPARNFKLTVTLERNI